MTAFYNEWDWYPAQWTRNLIAAGHIADGVVDERSIEEITPDDVRGHRQVHWFSGIGGWSVALRLAGVPDDADAWTGSCPCQPLSVAGVQRGASDPRHLWPVWYRLIAECRPAILFGEQASGTAGRAWLAAVRHDLEGLGYAVGAADLAAASVGAPHVRQRNFFGAVLGVGLADTDSSGWILEWRRRLLDRERQALGNDADRCGPAGSECCQRDCSCWDTDCFHRKYGYPINAGERYMCGRVADRKGSGWPEGGAPCRLAERVDSGRDAGASPGTEAQGGGERVQPRRIGDPTRAGGDPWADAELVACHDPKRGTIYRPVPPASSGIFPVAPRVRGDVAQLRASGNAIVPQVAAAFVQAFLEAVTALPV